VGEANFKDARRESIMSDENKLYLCKTRQSEEKKRVEGQLISMGWQDAESFGVPQEIDLVGMILQGFRRSPVFNNLFWDFRRA